VAQWIFGIAHNLCIDELRRMRARPNPVYDNDENPIIPQLVDDHVDVPATAWANEQRRVIISALASLPTAQRQAIELAYFNGLSHQALSAPSRHVSVSVYKSLAPYLRFRGCNRATNSYTSCTHAPRRICAAGRINYTRYLFDQQ
jgi:DNA-directed RNA polymerase specialized sigma24 family protein